MIDPRTVMVAIPAHDGRIMAELAGALQSSVGLFAAVSFPTECSHVSLVRNLIAGQFMASNFEWLVSIDSDIAFHRRDLELLLEPCALDTQYAEDIEERDRQQTEHTDGRIVSIQGKVFEPRPTRLTTALVVDRKDYNTKMVGAADALVCAQYSYKNDLLEPVRLGMGFVRIHRSVFEALQALKHDGGSTVEVQRHLFAQVKNYLLEQKEDSYTDEEGTHAFRRTVRTLIETAEDKAGTSRLWQTSHKGRMYYDYFPSGPLISQFVPTAEWKGEDHGFFTLCMLAGIVPRIETRTRVIHIGRKAYPYMGADSGGGQ